MKGKRCSLGHRKFCKLNFETTKNIQYSGKYGIGVRKDFIFALCIFNGITAGGLKKGFLVHSHKFKIIRFLHTRVVVERTLKLVFTLAWCLLVRSWMGLLHTKNVF